MGEVIGSLMFLFCETCSRIQGLVGADGRPVEVVEILQIKNSLLFITKGNEAKMNEVERLIKLLHREEISYTCRRFLTLTLKGIYMKDHHKAPDLLYFPLI